MITFLSVHVEQSVAGRKRQAVKKIADLHPALSLRNGRYSQALGRSTEYACSQLLGRRSNLELALADAFRCRKYVCLPFRTGDNATIILEPHHTTVLVNIDGFF